MSEEDRLQLETFAAQCISDFLSSGPETRLRCSINRIETATKDFAVIDQLLTNVAENHTLRLRSLYYRNAHLFRNQAECDRYLRGILRRAGCSSRSVFGILPKAKGMVGGSLFLAEGTTPLDNKWVEIDDDMIDTIDWKSTKEKSKLVLVLEKDTIFSYLMKYMSSLQSTIIITGCGFPDIASRRFLSTLNFNCDNMNILYFGDFDPHGYSIFLTYKLGSGSKDSAVEASRYRCSNLKLAGLFHSDVARNESQRSLTTTDFSVLKGIRKRLELGSTLIQSKGKLRRVEASAEMDLGVVMENIERMTFKCEFEVLPTGRPNIHDFNRPSLWTSLITSFLNSSPSAWKHLWCGKNSNRNDAN